MLISSGLKSWFFPALFFVCVLPLPVFGVNTDTLSQHTTWKTLIHSFGQHAQIIDPNFLLSSEKFSSLRELELTLEEYSKDPVNTFCKFPARITFLSKELNFDLPNDRFYQCKELKKFIDYVPFEEIELVYASEILSSATSMMGHIFMNAKGSNFKGTDVEHSLAYYTEISTLNPFRLIVESTLTGMSGFFMVRPFVDDFEAYVNKEKRNLWQFKLSASPDRLELMRLHIWELNQINITYLFQSFNCATLTLEILSLLNINLLEYKNMIVSPIDVVKALMDESMVIDTTMNASSHWLFKALRGNLSHIQAKEIDSIIFNRETNSDDASAEKIKRFLREPITEQYIIAASKEAFNQNYQLPESLNSLLNLANESNQTELDLSKYKHPVKTPQDSSVGFSWSDKNYIYLHYLPAGHFLYGDNRQYLSESELIIGKTTLAFDLDRHNINLLELTVYSARSFTPSHKLYPALSGEFYLGYREAFDKNINYDSLFELSGALGKSFSLHNDIMTYVISGGGFTTNISNSNAFLYIKSGSIINLVSDMKLNLEYEINSGDSYNSLLFSDASVVLSWFPYQDLSFSLKFSAIKNKISSSKSFIFYYNYYF